MTYLALAKITRDNDLILRFTACAASEGEQDPTGWVYNNLWLMAAQPGWSAAYAYALLTDNEAPGADAGVITDATILSAVQAIMTKHSEAEVLTT